MDEYISGDEQDEVIRIGDKTVHTVKETGPEEDDDKEDSETPSGSIAELQFINLLLTTRDYKLVVSNNLSSEYFPGYKDEFDFITNHYSTYKIVPDLTTFLSEFDDFDLLEVAESPVAVVTKLKEERAYALVQPALNEVNKTAAKNAIEAAELMKTTAENILKHVSIVRYNPGYDLFKNAQDRADEYVKKLGLNGVLGCLSNIPKLDDVTHGWMETDFLAITARPQEGKSWIAEYLSLMPWLLQKKKIVYFSLENSKSVVGYRADTLLKHFSNDSLMAGKEVLGWKNHMPTLTKDDYLAYIEAAKNYDIPFTVFDNSDSIEGSWTIEDIGEVIDREQPDFVMIDQLSLLGVKPRVKSIREGYVHSTRSTRRMVNEMKLPICLVCQSGRESAKANQKDKSATPELSQIAESDSVGQDATKVLSLKNMDGFIKLSLKKNTTGRSNLDFMMKWDIDSGELEPIVLDGDPFPEQNF